MEPTLAVDAHPVSNSSIDKSMRTRKLSVPNGPSSYVSVTEVELTATHTFDRDHLDPSCPECRQVRAQLEFIAKSCLAQLAAMQTEISFKIFTDPGIVCSPADGQRPSVTVSIYLWNQPGTSNPHCASAAVSCLQRALAALGVRNG